MLIWTASVSLARNHERARGSQAHVNAPSPEDHERRGVRSQQRRALGRISVLASTRGGRRHERDVENRGDPASFRRPAMSYFLALLIDGALAGAIYALIALAFVLVYRASAMMNFALGEWVV